MPEAGPRALLSRTEPPSASRSKNGFGLCLWVWGLRVQGLGLDFDCRV